MKNVGFLNSRWAVTENNSTIDDLKKNELRKACKQIYEARTCEQRVKFLLLDGYRLIDYNIFKI